MMTQGWVVEGPAQRFSSTRQLRGERAKRVNPVKLIVMVHFQLGSL